MNKVVCHVCGTSYPENATQCPICGFARASEKNASVEGSYTYVKGGRFSKSNVKKRSQSGQSSVETHVGVKGSAGQGAEKSSAGMVIIVIILLLAIIAVVGYIALRFFLPNDYIFEGLDNFTLPSVLQESETIPNDPLEEPVTEPIAETEDTAVSLACTAVILNSTDIQFDSIGSTFTLTAAVEPADTIDVLSFVSADEAVATVSDTGVVTAVGQGSTTVTVTCGTVSVSCAVRCTLPTTAPDVETLLLNRKEITFDSEGQSWMLYDGAISIDDITWSSDDNKVATITAGKVVAVGEGDTTVYAIYGDQTVSCVIHCKFDEEGSGENGGVSEAGGDTAITYTLYNPTGYSDDVTLKVGDKFTLKLVDENKNEITGAEWKVKDSKVCSYKDSTVEALKSGTTEITATYEGKTYTCIVRVK